MVGIHSGKGGGQGGRGPQDIGRASALRQPDGDRCVTFASGMSADIDSGPFCFIIT